jgi:hypothetical protein
MPLRFLLLSRLGLVLVLVLVVVKLAYYLNLCLCFAPKQAGQRPLGTSQRVRLIVC